MSDDSGNVSDQYRYAAFGELLNSSGDTDNAYLFTGEQYDDSVDNYYLRARYYNPEVGRFTRQDEWMGRDGEPVTLNKYLYTHADPVNNLDPSGNITLAGVMSAINIQSSLRIVNTSHKVNQVRRTAARLCNICAKLAKRANDEGELLLKFSYRSVGKATGGTKYHAHHVIQDAAMRVKFDTTYRKALGLAVPLFGNSYGGGAKKGSPHYNANQAQKGSVGKNPVHVAYSALTAAGCRSSDAREIVQMFEVAYKLEGWL
ncbi:RHS repeat-associated core domain-containing protein [Rheinheimera baltica]|uniref:RHS repeat-associated core domain-containing protein n=1 Tax=Rheinheimera baltica TaxID=67576 RepID=A0ABT9I4C5_9GAMM|nr:RHS repeat-associated core domain-containing protein [Rheinheimera baltica]MDP5138252.1 RHS repeat-associated core domain-containing protein [Rheinheimera baltica]MDP5148611.1 RHS repeat-associated core domain-containing protein [Rheinheimera baltica]